MRVQLVDAGLRDGLKNEERSFSRRSGPSPATGWRLRLHPHVLFVSLVGEENLNALVQNVALLQGVEIELLAPTRAAYR